MSSTKAPYLESEMSAQNPNTACEHGHQARKCPYCELEELEQQRDAALKLADRLERFAYYRETDIGAAEYESGEAAAFRESAKYLHTIFAPKEGD